MAFEGSFYFNDKNDQDKKLNESEFKNSNIRILRKEYDKFSKDKLFFEHSNKIFLLDGVILNNHELEREYGLKSWKETFIQLYEEDKFRFLTKLRGSFIGLIYDIENKKLTLFTDQLKSKSIFYKLTKDEFIFSTNLSKLASLNIKENTLDEEAAYLLLTFGGTLEERTLFKEIKKLNFATFLEIDLLKNIEKKQYWMFDNKEDFSIKEEMVIEKIDKLFKQAIKREYDKDLEYGYKHLVALSAGRDSRMNTWVAHELGYQDNVLNVTFSETNQLDEIIPKRIANELKHEWLFKALDNGNCCYDIEEISKVTCGEVHYGTVCHSNSMSKNLNYSKFGVLHTGQIGEVFGNSKLEINNNNLEEVKYIYSKKLLKKVIHKKIIRNFYKNEEIFNHINRGIYVTCEGSILSPNLYYTSPFLDIDFLEFCLKIPNRSQNRNWHKMYDRWILEKYPKAASYTHNGRKIGGKEIKILGRYIPVRQLIPRILKKIGLLKREKGMNPFDEWYKNNSKLRNLFDNYYKENIERLYMSKELKEDCIYLYESGNAREKAQVIGLLAVLKLYFK